VELKAVVIRENEFRTLTTSPTGPVGRDLNSRGRRLAVLAKSSVGRQTGALRNSISSQLLADSRGLFVKVGSPLDYALHHHDGTRPHLIKPRSGRVIRFVSKGTITYVRSVLHPGTRPTYFLTRHLPEVVQ